MAIATSGRDKVVANGLRELDRFLHVLIDEVAALVDPRGLDQVRFARLRNTANKLHAIRQALALASPDHERLRAIGRTRDGLFHCAEIVRRGDVASARRAGATAHAGRLTPDADELARVCHLYDRIAAELLDACRAHIERSARTA